MLGKGAIEAPTPGFMASKMSRRARQIMTAGKSDEEALELTDLEMSVYSYHLKSGQNGKADQNGDGVITMSEIQVHVEKKVSARTSFKQNPQWRDLLDTDGGEFVFVPTRFAKWAKKQDDKPSGWTPDVHAQKTAVPGAREIYKGVEQAGSRQGGFTGTGRPEYRQQADMFLGRRKIIQFQEFPP